MSVTNCTGKYLNVTEFTSLWIIRNVSNDAYTSSPVSFSDRELSFALRQETFRQNINSSGLFRVVGGPFNVEVRNEDPDVPSPYFSLSVIGLGDQGYWYLIPTGEINCIEPPSTTEPGEVPIPLDSDVPILTPCPVSSSGTSSSSPAGGPGEIAPWGVKFKYVSESPLLQRPSSTNSPIFPTYCSKTWSLSLLPAMQSNTRYGGGVDVPGALPGLAFKAVPSIARHKVPGFQPVYQHMGIDSVTVTMVGCFTGADGEGDNVRAAFDNMNVSLLGDNAADRRAALRKLDSYRSFQEFYRIAVQEGRELAIEVNLKHSNRFEGRDSTPPTGLRNSNGNPEFKGLVKRLETYYVRSDRTWYTMDIELTDYKLISNEPINLLPPTPTSPTPTSPTPTSPTTPLEGTGLTEGEYYVWNFDVKNKVSNELGLLEDLYENQVDRVVREKLLETSPVSVSKNENDEWTAGAVILEEVSCSDIQQSELRDLILEYSVNVTLPEERSPVSRIYPCNIIRTDNVLVISSGISGNPPGIYIPRTNLFRPRWLEVLKGYAELVLRSAGCASLLTGAFSAAQTSLFAAGLTFLSLGSSTPVSGTVAILSAFLAAGLGAAAVINCTSLFIDLNQLLGNTFGGDSLEENNTRFLQTLYSEGQSKTILGITFRFVLEIFAAMLPGLLRLIRSFLTSSLSRILNARNSTALINASSQISTSSASADMSAIRRIGNLLRRVASRFIPSLSRISDVIGGGRAGEKAISRFLDLFIGRRITAQDLRFLEGAVFDNRFLENAVFDNTGVVRGNAPYEVLEEVLKRFDDPSNTKNFQDIVREVFDEHSTGIVFPTPTPTPAPTTPAPPTPTPAPTTPAPPTPTPSPTVPSPPASGASPPVSTNSYTLLKQEFSRSLLREIDNNGLSRAVVSTPEGRSINVILDQNTLGRDVTTDAVENFFHSIDSFPPDTEIDFIFPDGTTNFDSIITLGSRIGLRHIELGKFIVL